MIESPALRRKIDDTSRAVLDAFGEAVRAVYVMGSITREATDASDLDIAVVFDDTYYGEHIDHLLPTFASLASGINRAHPAHPLALWASKADHYQTLFPDVSYVRRNLPRDTDRLDAWAGLAKHTLLHYEAKSATIVHGDFDIGKMMVAKVPRSEAVELFLLSTRTLAEGLAELSHPGEDTRRAGLNHVAKAGLRALYAVAIREQGQALDSYAEIQAWGAAHCAPPYDAIVSDLHAIKSGRLRPETPPISAVLHLMRHCEHRIADAPRQKMGGMTLGRAGESFAFSPGDLFRDADPIEQYSRFAGLGNNHVHALYFLLTARAIFRRLVEARVEDDEVLDFFFEELSVLASFAFFNPGGLQMVLGLRERDVFTLTVDRPFLQDMAAILSRLEAAADRNGVHDTPWLTADVKRGRLRTLLSQYATVPGIEVPGHAPPDVPGLIEAATWQARILTGVFNPRLVEIFNTLGLSLYRAGEAEAARAVLAQPLAAVQMAKQTATDIALTDNARLELDRELSKTHHYFGVACRRLGEPVRAREAYLEALAKDPDNYSALDDLTSLLLATDPGDESAAVIARLVDAAVSAKAESRRQVSAQYVTHALDVKQAGDHDEAEAWYRRAIDVDPSFEKAPYNLGILLEQTGRPAEAASMYQMAIDANASYALPYVRLGQMLERSGQVDAAEQVLVSGAANGASSEHLFANLANCQFAMGKLQLAWAHYQKALEVNPRHADAWNGLGAVLMQGGDPNDEATFRQAAECFRRAVAIDASFAGAEANRQQALRRLAALEGTSET